MNSKLNEMVHIDESYIHKNYYRYDDSLNDPNDEQDHTTGIAHKGQRYCSFAAIVDSEYSIHEEENG